LVFPGVGRQREPCSGLKTPQDGSISECSRSTLGSSTGRWGALAPRQEHILPVFRRIESTDQGCSCLQAEQRAGSLGPYSAVSTKSALNPSDHWPVDQLWCFEKHDYLARCCVGAKELCGASESTFC
jgi:hypothetical protein